MPEGEIFIEKRRHARKEKILRAAYKCMETDEEAGERDLKNEKIQTYTADISISGIQLLCEESFDIDTVLRLDVFVDDVEKPLATFAEVRWCFKDPEIKKYRTGLEFLVIKEDHIAVIRKITE
ncbi:MAG: PilZ domain-containing protein [Candidatus Goldiibacteriota bacterium]